MILRVLCVTACVLAAGCSDLKTIEHPVCGNGIIEEGEDCDSPMAYCQACSIACDSTEACVGIAGDGFVCGADDLCHAPAGTFARGESVALDVDTLRIADIDGDRIGDVLAQSPTTVTVLYGDTAASLASRASVQSPIAQGPVTWALLDGDDKPDLLVPTADGAAAFTFPYGTPSPYPWPSLLDGAGPNGAALATYGLTDQYIAAILAGPSGELLLIVLDVSGGKSDNVVGQIALCGAQVSNFDAARTSIATIAAGPTAHLMLAAVLANTSGAKSCVIALDQKAVADPLAPFNLATVAVPLTPAPDPQQRPLLLDLAGQGGCPTLVVQSVAGAIEGFAPQPTGVAARPCNLGAAAPIQRRAPDGSLKVTGSPLGAVALRGTDVGIVLTDGVYLYTPGSPARLAQFYVSDRTLAEVHIASLDGDANVDLVAIGDHAEDFDLLYQQQVTSPTMTVSYGFQRVRFDSEAEVTRVMPADFDGNGYQDIAYVERFDDGDRLSIAYGTADRPLPGQPVGTFASVISLLPVSIPDSTDPFGTIDDLAVLYTSDSALTATQQLAVLHGSPQRTMQAYFEPFGPDQPGRPPVVAILPGLFGGGLGGHDLLALGTVPAALPFGGTLLGLFPAASGGELSTAVTCGLTSTLGPCVVGDAQTRDLCTNLASYAVAPMGAGKEALMAVDGRGNAVTIDPSAMPACDTQALATPTEVPVAQWGNLLNLQAAAATRRARTLEMISDDPPELAVTLAPGRTGNAADYAVRACTLDAGVGATCRDPADAVAGLVGEPVVCTDLAAAHASAVTRLDASPRPPRKDLLAVCVTQGGVPTVYRLSRFADHETVAALFAIDGAGEIKVGDVNGDALDDVIVLERGMGSTRLTVFTQCSSRNAATCGAM